MRETWQICPRHEDYSDATFRRWVGFWLVRAGRVVSSEGVLSCHSLPVMPAVVQGVVGCDRPCW